MTPSTVLVQTYHYAASASDPNLDPLTYRVTSGPSNLVINPATGLVSWTPTPDQTGIFQLALAADDGLGGVATQSFQVQVLANSPNRPPVFQTAPTTLVPTGTNYLYQPAVSDADGDTLQYFLDTAPASMSINGTTGRVEFPNATAGQFAVTLRAADGHGGRATQTYVLTVGTGTASGAPQIVSTPQVRGLVPATALCSRLVVIKVSNIDAGQLTPKLFAAARKQLTDLGLSEQTLLNSAHSPRWPTPPSHASRPAPRDRRRRSRDRGPDRRRPAVDTSGNCLE